jgi:SAM-dependent methyltransferase
MRLYTDLAAWFPLLTAPADYAAEAARYEALALAACPTATTLLELGSGGGNNASHLKRRFTCTLTDLSPQMLEVSRALNPECEHLEGDMRSLRLGRRFDVVFVHDAVSYLTCQADLRACIRTAAEHVRDGGVVVLAPDCTAESLAPPGIHSGGHDAPDGRGLRYLEWSHRPERGHTRYDVDFVVILRHQDGTSEVVSERHTCGVFTEATWLRLLDEEGLDATLHRGDPDDDDAPQDVFVGVRRA